MSTAEWKQRKRDEELQRQAETKKQAVRGLLVGAKPGKRPMSAKRKALGLHGSRELVRDMVIAGRTDREIAEATGLTTDGVKAAKQWWRNRGSLVTDIALNQAYKIGVVPRDKLTPENRAFLKDTPEAFRAWNDHFFPKQPMPEHMVRVIRRCYDYERARWRTNIWINIGPGFSKSVYLARRWTIWRLCRPERDWRIGIISESNQLAADWVQEISEILESDIGLITAYGPFRNDQPNTWRTGHAMFKVLGAPTSVRWNVIARGREQQIQGMRLDELVIDDPETPDTILSIEERERVVRRIDYVLENRLEPEIGILRGISTRFEMNDIPGMLTSRTWEDGTPIWEHVSYPALHDPTNPEVASIAPDAVSTWPARFPLALLRKKLEKDPITFESAFQQNPRPAGSATFEMEWILGRKADENPRKGCLDFDRVVGAGADEGHWPGEKIRCISLDPSGGAGWWALLVADVNSPRDSGDFRAVIVDIRRGKWTTADFLDQVKDVCEASKGAGRPVRFFIPESNMRADLWNGDNLDFTRIRLAYDFKVDPHRTDTNKRDIFLGVKSLAVDFLDGRVRIPYGDEHARRDVAPLLIREIHDHPNGRTDDVLMSLWFLKHRWKNLYLPPRELLPADSGWDIPSFAWEAFR